MKPTTGRRVGVTRAARPALADVNYHKVLPLGVGAGHRVGIPSGAAVTPNGSARKTARYLSWRTARDACYTRMSQIEQVLAREH